MLCLSVPKSILCLLFGLLLSQLALTQTAKIDSLNRLIRLATTNTARINLTNTKIGLLSKVDINAALALGEQAIAESKKINYPYGGASAKLNQVIGLCTKGNYHQAALYLHQAEQTFTGLQDSLGICKTYSGYGTLYGMQGKYDSATEYLEKAVAIAERNRYQSVLPTFYGNIAVSYQMQSSYLRALDYQQKALDLAKSTNNNNTQAYTLLNMGLTYASMGDTARSKQYIRQSIDIAKASNLANVELYGYSNLANILLRPAEAAAAYRYAMLAVKLGQRTGDPGMTAASLARAAVAKAKLGDAAGAVALARQAIAIADSSGQNSNIFAAYAVLGGLLKDQARYREAIPFLQKSIGVAAQTDLYDESVSSAYRDLSICCEQTGQPSEALRYYKFAATITDSVHRRDNIRKATELGMNYEFEKKETAQRIVQQNKDAVTHTRQIALVAVLALITLLAIVALRAYHSKQKANATLLHQKENLQQALLQLEQAQAQLIQAEKMASLGELTAGIAHEIQNPLNFVNNFAELSAELATEMEAELQAGNTEEAVALATDVKANLHKISHHGKRADAIVKSMLQHTWKGTGERQPTNLNTLADEFLKLSYHGFRAKNPYIEVELIKDLQAHLPEAMLVKEDIGRVLLNLFGNALYAVAQKKTQAAGGPYQPTITVRSSLTDHYLCLEVHDNGTGIPRHLEQKVMQPFFTTKPTGEGIGLGLSISYDIVVKGHGGKMEVRSEEGRFTCFTVLLPVS